MALQSSHTLTISLVNIGGKNVANILVQVSLTDPELIYPLGMPTETLFPTVQHLTTNENGIAVFNLLPSSQVGNYNVLVGSYQRQITMPDSDVRFEDIRDYIVDTCK